MSTLNKYKHNVHKYMYMQLHSDKLSDILGKGSGDCHKVQYIIEAKMLNSSIVLTYICLTLSYCSSTGVRRP